jgi:hypothetical protein
MGEQEMHDKLGLKFIGSMYTDLLDKLNTLVVGVPAQAKGPVLEAFLREFTRPGTALQRPERARPALDDLGRSYTIASR